MLLLYQTSLLLYQTQGLTHSLSHLSLQLEDHSYKDNRKICWFALEFTTSLSDIRKHVSGVQVKHECNKSFIINLLDYQQWCIKIIYQLSNT